MNNFDITANQVIPVVVIDELKAAIPLAETLLAHGVSTMEITLRTPNALAVIEKIAKALPVMQVGAGTVRTPDDFRNALNAGAQYIIAPGVTPKLLEVATTFQEQVQFIPGVVTPSQAMECSELGFNYLKFFPAEAYNAFEVIKALAAPLPELRFCPTGGITITNMVKYLDLANVFAVGMSGIVDSRLIQECNYSEIGRRTELAVNIAKQSLTH